MYLQRLTKTPFIIEEWKLVKTEDGWEMQNNHVSLPIPRTPISLGWSSIEETTLKITDQESFANMLCETYWNNAEALTVCRVLRALGFCSPPNLMIQALAELNQRTAEEISTFTA